MRSVFLTSKDVSFTIGQVVEVARSGAKNQRKHSQRDGCDLQLRDELASSILEEIL
jgi:hypothetical protein